MGLRILRSLWHPVRRGVGRLLRGRNGVVASIATVLWALGIFLLAFTANFYRSPLAAIDAASGSAPTTADARYQAAVVNNIVLYPMYI